ncbi:MAG: hypothetical protein AAF824_24485, partial [Bacteroidota bacterium]
MGRSIHHKRYVGHVPICLLFLSLWLWGGNLQAQNLDCGNATAIDLCAFIEGNTSAGAANNDGYFFDPNSPTFTPATGKEVVYDFFTSLDRVTIKLESDNPGLQGFILGNCNNIQDGFPLAYTFSDGSNSFIGEVTIDLNDIPGYSNNTFYIVVEESRFQPDADYTLQVGDANGPPCPNPNDPCANPVELTVGSLYEGSTIDGTSVFTTYGNGQVLAGAEIVHRFEWPGGTMKATLSPGDVLFGLELDLMLLGSCDPNDFIASEPFAGLNETITQNLPAGTYFLVVDGFGETDVDFYKLLVEREDPPQDPCDNPITLTEGDLYTGSNQNGTTTFNQYVGLQFGNDGPEVVHVINWPGGEMQATLTAGNPDLGTDLDLILLDNCDVNSLIEAPQNTGSNEQIIRALAAGTYYLIVDGYQAADINNYTLLVENLTPQGDLCGDGSNVSTSLQCGVTVSFTPSGQNLDTHCGQDGYTGAERIYQINWDGGRFIATLEEKTPGQELILYSSCDPNSCIRIEPNQIDIGLSTGTYYLVVDGKNGATGRYTLSLTNPDDPDCILPDFQVESIEGDNCVQPGDVATYTATVGNDGDRAFTQEELGVSVDRFYLAKDREAFNNFQEITETSVPSQQVRPGDTYTTTGSISIPDNIEPGDYIIIFFADADQAVTEAFAGGNIITYPISIGNNNGPDYVPSNLQAPNAANPEEDIRIRVTLANEGNANGSASG